MGLCEQADGPSGTEHHRWLKHKTRKITRRKAKQKLHKEIEPENIDHKYKGYEY